MVRLTRAALIACAALAGSAAACGAVTYPWPDHLGELTLTYTFNEGPWAGETASLEVDYVLYDLLDDGFAIDNGGYETVAGCPPVNAAITFAGLTSSEPAECIFIKVPDDILETESAVFYFDPAENPFGIVGLASYGGGGFVVYYDDLSEAACQYAPGCTKTTVWRETPVAPVPLPVPALLLLGGVAALGAIGRGKWFPRG